MRSGVSPWHWVLCIAVSTFASGCERQAFPPLAPLDPKVLPPSMHSLRPEPVLSQQFLEGILAQRLKSSQPPPSSPVSDVHPCALTAAVFSAPGSSEAEPGQGQPVSLAQAAGAHHCFPDKQGQLPAGEVICSAAYKHCGVPLWFSRPGHPVLELYFVPLPDSGFELSPLQRKLAQQVPGRYVVLATELGCS